MEVENLEKVAEQLLYRRLSGLGLTEKLTEGLKEFSIVYNQKIKDDDIGYQLNFKVNESESANTLYFNSFTVNLNGNREHTFTKDSNITAIEAYHMLKYGLLVAVNKNLFNKEGNKYNTWLAIDINGSKDEWGNYPVKSFHENYFLKKPFNIQDLLLNLPDSILIDKSPASLAETEKQLMKANLIEVATLLNEVKGTAFLSVNPEKGRIDPYTKEEILEKLNPGQQHGPTHVPTKPDQQQQDEKKKPWENRKMNFNKSFGKGRGI